MKTVYRTLTAQLDTSSFRTETLQGKKYLVVPGKVLRGDYVMSAQGSEFPELVPASEIEQSVILWNNRPIMTDHPIEGSANSPEVLELDQFGVTFNTTFEDNFLQPELWFDEERTAELGGAHEQILNNTKAGIPSEVSVGVRIQLELREGTSEGQEFKGIWRNLQPDHVAVGLDGAKGACDIATGGCGIRTGKEEEMKLTRKDFEAMFRSAERRAAQDVGKSARDLESQLWDALEASSIPDVWTVKDWFPDSSTVIYSTWPFDGPMRLWRHQFESVDTGVTLIGEPEEVIFTSTFLTVSREALTTNEDSGTLRVQGGNTMTEAEIQSLIAGDNQFTVDDQEMLAGLPEGFAAKLTPAIVEEAESKEESANELVEAVVPPGMILFPEADLAPIQAAAKAYGEQQTAAREAHTTTLQECPCCQLTDDDMRDMSVATLSRLVTGLPEKVVDYSGQGANPREASAPTVAPAPKPYTLAREARNV